ncbi:MAG TPA: glutathione peroxidase [Acetobacteraceae bacterium]|nr:glutathione peroxidase [Acetobacteraceae bacterium]
MTEPTRRVLLMAAMGVGVAANKEALAWDFSFPAIDEGRLDFATFKGRVLLVTNTASFCGYTYQYEGLEKLHKADEARGLTVIGVPSQDFNQESADNGTVKTFCEATFGVQFPMAGISHVRGASAAPFYAWVREQRRWEPGWNFNKVLIGRDGRIAGTFGSGDEPQGPKLSQAIAAALQQS